MKHILTFLFFVVSLSDFIVATYFATVKNKREINGLGEIMIKLYISKGLLFGLFALIGLFEIYNYRPMILITLLPFMWFEYRFIKYLFKL